jgi:hypothetical protein
MTERSTGEADLVRLVGDALRAGDHMQAFDQAKRGVEAFPGSLTLKHLAVLSLARLGALDHAGQKAREYGLRAGQSEDICGLLGRLAKDLALQSSGRRRPALLARSAAIYAAGAGRFRSPYLAVNAGSMFLLAGMSRQSRRWAAEALRFVGRGDEEQSIDYWSLVTELEAHLLLGDRPAVLQLAEIAVRAAESDAAKIASTRRQLDLLAHLLPDARDVLAVLRIPLTIHYSGHAVDLGRFRDIAADEERTLRRSVGSLLAELDVGFAFGSLASGADLIFVAELLKKRCMVTIVLPCSVDGFEASSVAFGGARWVRRFRRIVGAASAGSMVRIVSLSNEPEVCSDVYYKYCTRHAIGLAKIHARSIAGEVKQIAIADRIRPLLRTAGTAYDLAAARGANVGTIVIPGHALRRPAPAAAAAGASGSRGLGRRFALRGIIFGDFAGFSKLPERAVAELHHIQFREIHAAIQRYAAAILEKNTWGDSIHLVVEDADSTARCCLEIQRRLRNLQRRAAKGPSIGLRLACHFGPVRRDLDLVRGTRSFFGVQLSRCARIEPIALAGEVFASEPLAAELELTSSGDLRFEYAGLLETAKGYGRMRMFMLKEAAALRQP